MTSRSLKAVYYVLLSFPMRLNGYFYRYVRQQRTAIKVHLGCGQKNYIPGWVNLDANIITARRDVWANLIHGLPFRDGSVEKCYSFHVIEHLPDTFIAAHFRDMYRCLMPGGAIRVGGPHADNACKKLVDGDARWFPDYPDVRTSIGGRFANFVFCRNEHLTALTASYLEELATSAGFADIQFCAPVTESRFFDEQVMSFEYETDHEYPHSLVMEARKPQAATQ